MTRYKEQRICDAWDRAEVQTLLRLARKGIDMRTLQKALPGRSAASIRAKLRTFSISSRQRCNSGGRPVVDMHTEPAVTPALAPWPDHAPLFQDVDPRYLTIERIRSPGRMATPSISDHLTMGGVTGSWG
jgi:hypothetical protein